MSQELDYEVVQPEGEHRCTVIYLYGRDSRACSQYAEAEGEFPWQAGSSRAPNLRTVLVDIQQLDFQRVESKTSWAALGVRSNRAGDPQALEATRQWIADLVQEEVQLLGKGQNVFLGGFMQGCTLALDMYLREARRLQLGGFVGSVGFMPTDKLGFEGASKVWLQCTTDDHEYAPWRTVVKPSLARATTILPGLLVREVSGLSGHALLRWEAQLLSKFLHEHVPLAYAAPRAHSKQARQNRPSMEGSFARGRSSESARSNESNEIWVVSV